MLTANSDIGIKKYIVSNTVEREGTWATDLEMYALSHLLMCIYYYSDDERKWLQMKPNLLDRTIVSSDCSSM